MNSVNDTPDPDIDIDIPKEVVIGEWADYISLDWGRIEDRPMLRILFPMGNRRSKRKQYS
jgi:hypothetical protein